MRELRHHVPNVRATQVKNLEEGVALVKDADPDVTIFKPAGWSAQDW